MSCFHDWFSNGLRCCVSFNWDVSLMMCLCGCVQNHFLLLRQRSFSKFFFILYFGVRVSCVARFVFLQLFLDLRIVRVDVFPELCICKWSVWKWFVRAIFKYSTSFVLFEQKVNDWFRVSNVCEDIYLFQCTSAVGDLIFVLLFRRMWNCSKEDLVDL